MRILAVDDDPVFLQVLNVTLNSIGYKDLTTASSAEDALTTLKRVDTPFDCLLLDIQMPGMDGVELCRAIRTMPEYRTAPILMITAMSERTFIDNAFLVGATDYVSKPVDAGELRARLGTLVNLLTKTREARELEHRLKYESSVKVPNFAFQDDVMLEDVPGLIGLLAFENYMLQIGSVRMFVNSVVGFHVENASDAFAGRSRQDYLDIMSSTADVIWRCTPGGIVFAYAGNGDFVALIERMPEFQQETIEEDIRVKLELEADIWSIFGCSVPRVRVGKPVHQKLLGANPPSYTMLCAREVAKNPAINAERSWFSRIAG